MHLLIACAGSGRRMGAERNKLLLQVAGRPVLAWTLDAVLAAPVIRWSLFSSTTAPAAWWIRI